MALARRHPSRRTEQAGPCSAHRDAIRQPYRIQTARPDTDVIDQARQVSCFLSHRGSLMDAKSEKTKTAALTVGNNNWDFPIYPGTIGPDVVDISKLYGQSGMFTYDPGFTSTASCESKITYIDGDEGILLYRGYPIEQLAE